MAAAPGLTAHWARLNGAARLPGIDLARGLAIVGMFAAHMIALPTLVWTDAGTWAGIADGRSSILFATLAGVSLSLVTGGTTPLGSAAARGARQRIAVRAALIWLLGIVLIGTGVPVYVILPAYAVLFLLALPLLRWGCGALFALGGGLALIMPFVQVFLGALPLWTRPEGEILALVIGWHYPFPVWSAFLVCGMAVGRLDLRSARTPWALAAGGAALAVIGYAVDAALGAEGALSAAPHSSGLLEVIGSGGFAVAVIGVCLILCRTAVTWVVLPLRATGAMPLTAYTGQLVGWAVVAAASLDSVGDLSGFRAQHPFAPFTIVVILACTAWALLVGRGPLEWMLDRASRAAVRFAGGRRR